MATPKKTNQKETQAPAASQSREVASTAKTSVAELADAELFAADAGAGREEASSDSYAIPFLVILQKGSPQVDEEQGAYIEGAKAGMFLNNVTNQLYSGKEGLAFIPVYFKREFLRWGAREGGGGGFKGVIAPETLAKLRQNGEVVELEGGLYFPNPDGSINPKRNDRVSDHRNHYGLILGADGETRPCLLSLTSTQIKKSKLLMSALADVRVMAPDNKRVNPASWANKVLLTTVGEQNDKGTWFGLRTELDGFVTRDQYAAGKAFYESVKKGTVEVKYEDTEAAQGSGRAPHGAESNF